MACRSCKRLRRVGKMDGRGRRFLQVTPRPAGVALRLVRSRVSTWKKSVCEVTEVCCVFAKKCTE